MKISKIYLIILVLFSFLSLVFIVEVFALEPPVLIALFNKAYGIAPNPNFQWNAVEGATGYWVDITDDPDFTKWWGKQTERISAGWDYGSGVAYTHYPDNPPPRLLTLGKTYYWRVYAYNSTAGVYSKWRSFTVHDGNTIQKYGAESELSYYYSEQNSDTLISEHISTVKKDIGIQISRNSVHWASIEPVKGQRDWSVLDKIVDELVSNDIEPLLYFFSSPSWASGMESEGYGDSFVPSDEQSFVRWMEEYKVFVRDTVNRYKDRVKKWELWNEPNLQGWWYPNPDSKLYGRWADAMHQEIKNVDPSAQVAWGSLTLLDEISDSSKISGDKFLEDLYSLGYYPDIISLHPYALRNESPDVYFPFDNHTTFRDVETMKQVMERNGQSNKEIWVTEFGWKIGSSSPDGILMSEELQAANLKRSLEIVRDEWPYVSVVIWFWDLDRHVPQYAAVCDGLGLIRVDKTIRPSGLYFREFLKK